MTVISFVQRRLKERHTEYIHVLKCYLPSGAPYLAIVGTDMITGKQIDKVGDLADKKRLLKKGSLLEKIHGHDLPLEMAKKYNI